MPVVKVNPGGRVQARGLSAPLQSFQPDPAAGFVRTAQQAIGAAGRINDQRVRDQLAVDNTRADEADVELQTRINGLLHLDEDAYFNRQGKSAFESRGDTETQIQGWIEELGEGLDNDSQRKLFTETARARFSRSQLKIAQHATQQQKVWQRDTSLARAETALQAGALDYSDDSLELNRSVGRFEIGKVYADAPPERRELELAKWDSSFYSAAVDRALDAEDVQGARAIVEKYGERLHAQDRSKIDARFASHRKQKQAEFRDELELEVRDAVAAYEQGLPVRHAPTLEDFRKAYGREDATRRYGEFKMFQDLGKDLAAVPSMDSTELRELLTSRAPSPGTGFADASKRYAALVKSVTAIEKERQTDPVAFIAKYGTVDLGTASFDDVLTEQRRLGVTNPRLLSTAKAEDLVSQFSVTDDGGSNAAEMINQLQEQFGEHWPVAYRQLASAGIPAAAIVIGSGVPRATAEALARTAGVKTEDLKTGLESPKDAKNAVTEELLELQATFSHQAGGNEMFATIHEQSERLAYVYMAQGKTAVEAARQATAEIANERYNYAETYRIPETHNADLVQSGADATLEALTIDDVEVALPTGVTDTYNEALFDRMKEDSYWVTSSKEDGLVLYYQDAALVNDEGPVFFTWDELAAKGEPGIFESVANFIAPEPRPLSVNKASGLLLRDEEGNRVSVQTR